MSRKSRPGSFAVTLTDRGAGNGRRRYAVRLVGHAGARGAVLGEAPTKERAWGLAMGVLCDARARAVNFWDKAKREEAALMPLDNSTSGIILSEQPGTDKVQKANQSHADQ